MTNDQKLVFLIHQVDELIKAQEKYEASPSQIFKDAWKKKQREIKVWLIQNKVVSASAPEIRKQKSAVKKNSYINRSNWLAQ